MARLERVKTGCTISSSRSHLKAPFEVSSRLLRLWLVQAERWALDVLDRRLETLRDPCFRPVRFEALKAG